MRKSAATVSSQYVFYFDSKVPQDNPKPGSITTTITIPQGEEVRVCHVISTCENCADTVEAFGRFDTRYAD